MFLGKFWGRRCRRDAAETVAGQCACSAQIELTGHSRPGSGSGRHRPPEHMPLPWWQTLAIFVYAMIACLGVNDAVMVMMIKWRVLNAFATHDTKNTEYKGSYMPTG